MNLLGHLILWAVAVFLAFWWACWGWGRGYDEGFEVGWGECYDAYFPEIEGNQILSLDKPGTSFHTEPPEKAG